jgi:hypothetical protein
MCDLAAMVDKASICEYNSGFVYVHPSGLPLYKRMQEIAPQHPEMHDQQHMNLAVKDVSGLKIKPLSVSKFLAGQYYYNVGRHYADSMLPCPECIVVHNNWIVSVQAKIYRAKELHHWMYDGHQYYTSKTRKYVTYVNRPPYSDQANMEALKTGLAIGRILNRTLILPKFFCENKMCGLNFFLKVRNFDESFGGQYREYSFLTHELVPESIKSSVFKVTKMLQTGKQAAILNQFGYVTQSVLQFQYLNNTVTFSDPATHAQFHGLIQKGFVPGAFINF